MPIGRTAWLKILVQQLGRTHGPPWQEGIKFWQDEVVGPPLKNDPDTPMFLSMQDPRASLRMEPVPLLQLETS